MVRIIDNHGAVVIGLVRGELLDRLSAGERVCLPGLVDSNGLRHPHVCLFLRDNNTQLLEAINEYYPDGFVPGAVAEHMSAEEPK